jgi:hypothetical protein
MRIISKKSDETKEEGSDLVERPQQVAGGAPRTDEKKVDII